MVSSGEFVVFVVCLIGFLGGCCFYRLPILPYGERQIFHANLVSPLWCYLNCFWPVPVDSCGSARGTLVGPLLSQPLVVASQQTSLSWPHLLCSQDPVHSSFLPATLSSWSPLPAFLSLTSEGGHGPAQSLGPLFLESSHS